MSSISKLAVSLFLLTLISLHAMEENNSSYRSRGKQKSIKEKETTDNKFRRTTTNLALKETFYVLENGKVPKYADCNMQPQSRFALGLEKGANIDNIEKAQSIILERIDKFFSKKLAILAKHGNNETLSNVLVNGKEIYSGQLEEMQIVDGSIYEYNKNSFSSLLLKKNVGHIIDTEKNMKSLDKLVMIEFNFLLLTSIQQRVADHSLTAMIQGRNEKHENLIKQIKTAEDKAQERETRIQSLERQRNIGIPVAIVATTVVLGGGAYALGVIDTAKVGQLGSKVTRMFSSDN